MADKKMTCEQSKYVLCVGGDLDGEYVERVGLKFPHVLGTDSWSRTWLQDYVYDPDTDTYRADGNSIRVANEEDQDALRNQSPNR